MVCRNSQQQFKGKSVFYKCSIEFSIFVLKTVDLLFSKQINIFFHFYSLKIHFIHTKDQTAKAKTVVPLLLLHGWPGSVREFYEIIPKLTQAKDNVAYMVVAPSLPGYGFSEAARFDK